jgi:hypothetical protein
LPKNVEAAVPATALTVDRGGPTADTHAGFGAPAAQNPRPADFAPASALAKTGSDE